jgi:AraC-like DNA-binding protein
MSLAPDEGDLHSFSRWSAYMGSGVAAKVDHAIDELLLRIERIPFASFGLIEPDGDRVLARRRDSPVPFGRVRHICDFIADNFRRDIDVTDIATSAALHPKYAMNLFRQSTGMTLSEYINLLRLSYAQALLISDNEVNVLSVAMESGFGSLSAFNKSFRRIAGKSPSDFRRDYRPRRAYGIGETGAAVRPV